jgi:hypothetical protein
MRRLASLLVLLLTTAAYAAPPALAPQSADGVTVAVPVAWKHMITGDERNIVMSRDAATTITLHWHRFRDGASNDKMLDKLLAVTNSNLPLGAAVEQERHDVLGGRGKVMSAEFSTLGYVMKMGFAVVPHPEQGHIATAILLTTPEAWAELDGAALLAAVTDSLKAKLEPAPPETPASTTP